MSPYKKESSFLDEEKNKRRKIDANKPLIENVSPPTILQQAFDIGEEYSLGRIFFRFFSPTTDGDVDDTLNAFQFDSAVTIFFSSSFPNGFFLIRKNNRKEKKKQERSAILLKKNECLDEFC